MIAKVCEICNKNFEVKKYRSKSATTCSRSCSASRRMRIAYADKNNYITIVCEYCELPFSVLNKTSHHRKTCSKECQNKHQGRHLEVFRESNNKKPRKKLPPKITNCVMCNKEFEVSRKVSGVTLTCSKSCNIDLHKKTRRLDIKKDNFKELLTEHSHIDDIAKALQCSPDVVRRRAKEFDLELPKKNYNYVRHDGYYNYKSTLNHRNIYQSYYNVVLRPNQPIHHIDGDKLNNSIENLYMTDSSEHTKIHKQLESLAFELVSKGVISFDKEQGKYCINQDKIIKK